MKRSILCFASLVFLLLTFPKPVAAQQRVVRTIHAKTVDASRENNPNIISDDPQPLPRGATCNIYFTNYTGYYVKVYVDRYYRGQLRPGRGGRITVADGYKSIYCISAGGTKEWSDTGNCKGSYSFKLFP